MATRRIASSETCPQPRRQPTPRQWKFAALVASGAMSLSACFDAVYPSPSGERNLETLRTAASRLRRNPRVEWAIERITAEAKGGTKLERLKTRERARFADQVL